MSNSAEKTATVLVIEDEPDVRDFIKTALRHEPYELYFAVNGQEGLALMREMAPILVLLDLRMPVMNGIEFLETIKHTPSDEFSVIVLTGLGDDIEAKRCYDMGVNFFIRKPFGRLELTGAVSQAIELKRLQLELQKKNEQITRHVVECRELLHVLCHDLAGAVGSVASVLELANEDRSFFDKLFPDIRSALSNGLKVIEATRMMRTLDENERHVPLESIRLSEAVEEAAFLVSNKVKAKNITLRLDVEPKLRVLAERNSLVCSVLGNVLSNAVKYSYPDSAITVESERKACVVSLVVKDKGIGIPHNLLRDMYSITKHYGRPGTAGEVGTGFGMPLVKRYMEAYRGSVEAISRDEKEHPADHGTEVRLNFVTGMEG